MTSTVLLLIVVSFLVLALGFFAWRATSSRSAIVTILISSAGLLLAAYHLNAHAQAEKSVGIAFLAGMLLGGRGIGWWWRSRAQPELRPPSLMLIAASAMCIVATVAAYRSMG